MAVFYCTVVEALKVTERRMYVQIIYNIGYSVWWWCLLKDYNEGGVTKSKPADKASVNEHTKFKTYIHNLIVNKPT